MPEYELKDNLDRLPEAIYFTDSFLALHIDHKSNTFFEFLQVLKLIPAFRGWAVILFSNRSSFPLLIIVGILIYCF